MYLYMRLCVCNCRNLYLFFVLDLTQECEFKIRSGTLVRISPASFTFNPFEFSLWCSDAIGCPLGRLSGGGEAAR